jgi:hypothetical protein
MRNNNDWWKWVDVALGEVEVEAGIHLFEIKITKGDNHNLDYFQFTTVGEEVEPCDMICPECNLCENDTCIATAHATKCTCHYDIQVATSGTTRMEMETLDLSNSTIVSNPAAVPGGILDGQVGGHKDSKTGQQDRLYWFNNGTKFVILVRVEEACTLDIALVGWGGTALKNYTYTFDGEAINCTNSSSMVKNTPQSIGTVTVDAPGIYAFEVSIYSCDFDAVTFTVVE